MDLPAFKAILSGKRRGEGRRRTPSASAVAASFLGLFLAFCGCLEPVLAIEEGPDAPLTQKGSGGIEIDAARGEIRLSCRFVNPAQLIEVFACHKTGPTHETVVKFDSTGPDIYKALLAIGCRNASYWNGTSPDDFLRNQGDRLLVLVRWEYLGERHEYPAEAMLLDGETGFSTFVRGFSFGAREPSRVGKEEGSAPESGIPTAVEVTLGAMKRESPSYSLLAHPTNLARMEPWMFPPKIDTDAVKHHSELVENDVPATLIIRRLRGEANLIEEARLAAQKRRLEDRLPLYDRLFPIAGEIDRLKGEYEKLLSSIREFLALNGAKDLSEGERKTLEAQGKDLLRRGQWLCARIEERYLTLYSIEEEFKTRWVENQKDLPPEVRESTALRVRDGLAFEPRIAAKEVDIAALELAADEHSPADKKMLREALLKEIEGLKLERERRWEEASLREKTSQLEALGTSDPYMARLLTEDKMKAQANLKCLLLEGRIVESHAAELRGMLEGRWDDIKEGVLRERKDAQDELRIAEMERELVDVIEQIRWHEDDLESGVPDRSEKAREELEKSSKRKRELERRIDEARKALQKS